MKITLTKTSMAIALFTAVSLVNCSTSTTPPATTTVDCKSTPAKTGLTASTKSSQSHNTGKECLTCHSTGGTATSVWTVAGSMVGAKGSTTNAAAGSVVTVGSSNLIVDTCGNFYTSSAIALPAAASTSTKAMSALAGGSCNLSGCHDGTSRDFVY